LDQIGLVQGEELEQLLQADDIVVVQLLAEEVQTLRLEIVSVGVDSGRAHEHVVSKNPELPLRIHFYYKEQQA